MANNNLWKTEEIAQYKPRDNVQLKKMYENRGIPKTNPEERARFLAEEVLGLTQTDHDSVMRTAKEKGRAEALNYLEDMFIISYKGIK